MAILNASILAGIAVLPFTAHAAALGVATSNGTFRLDNSTVQGTATLREGSTVETSAAASDLRLGNGTRFALNAGSRARVFRDRFVLEKGSGEFTSGAAFRVESKTLRFSAEESGARAVIAIRGENKVQIASAAGLMRVRNAAGLLISNVEPGLALEFEPQVSGGALPSSFVGCLLKKDGKFVIYDQTTKMTIELRSSGPDLAAELGNRVQANGTARAGANNTQSLDVTTVTRIERGGCADVATQINADKPPATAGARGPVTEPKAAGTGMSAGTKVAIVAAVAGGGAGAAIAASQSGGARSR